MSPRLLLPFFVRLLGPLLLCLCEALASAPPFPEAWPESQVLTVSGEEALVCVPLPFETLDRLAPDCADLRLISDSGEELPWALRLPRPPQVRQRPVAGLRVRMDESATLLFFDGPGPDQSLAALELQTPQPAFTKALTLEGSNDERTWTLLLDRVPLLREGPSSRVRLAVPPSQFARYRATIREPKASAPLPVTGLSFDYLERSAPPQPGPVALLRREECADQTRLVLNFAARGAHLAELSLPVLDAAFSRQVRLLERSYRGEAVEERVLASAWAHGRPGAPASLRLVVDRRLPRRELVLVIENGDSPPLRLGAPVALYRPLDLLFTRPVSGSCRLYAGASQARLPAYDLVSLVTALNSGESLPLARRVNFAPFEKNPSFRETDRVPDIPLYGPVLDLSAWPSSRRVDVEKPGVHFLELDAALLASSAPHFADLRLVRGDRQIPYLLERATFQQALPAALQALPVAVKGPQAGVSRWEVSLPAAFLPLDSLQLRSPSPLFQRQLSLISERSGPRGDTFRSVLWQGEWARRSAEDSAVIVLRLHGVVAGERLFVEVANGDNLPIVLDSAELRVPAVRLHFKVGETGPLTLLHGNARAQRPSYDLSLVADRLLNAPHAQAILASTIEPEAPRSSFTARLGGYTTAVFWGVLVLVVATLLFIVARLMPKSPGNPPAGPSRS